MKLNIHEQGKILDALKAKLENHKSLLRFLYGLELVGAYRTLEAEEAELIALIRKVEREKVQ